MSDDKAAPKKGVRTVADLKVTGRNKEGEEPLTFGESILTGSYRGAPELALA